jgi:hypothetical protein
MIPDTEQQFSEVWEQLNNLQRRWVLARLTTRFDVEACREVGCHEKTPIKWRKKGVPIDRAIELLTLSSIRAVQMKLEELVLCAVDVLKGAMRTSDANGIRAAVEILDRVIGKPAQRTEITGADGGPVVLKPVAAEDYD